MVKASSQSGAAVAGFVGGFYAWLVGSKIFIALLVGRSRSFLTGTVYTTIMKGLAIALRVFAVLLFRDGLRLLRL